MLWLDTFNDHFFPDTLAAGLHVLESAGFQVRVPSERRCCGRLLYDYGMLDIAERRLDRILDALGPEIDRGIPVVGLEPSCMSVFRDELCGLKPNDARASRLGRQTFTLAELLLDREISLPHIDARLLFHGHFHEGHCHEKAVLGGPHGMTLLRRMGAQVASPESGCCGMAGAFGFERDHFEVSRRIAEERLAPAVRRAHADDLVVADGFSCREQIRHLTGRTAVHTAEVVRSALLAAGNGHEPPRACTLGSAEVRAHGDTRLRPASTLVPSIVVGAITLAGLRLSFTWVLPRSKERR